MTQPTFETREALTIWSTGRAKAAEIESKVALLSGHSRADIKPILLEALEDIRRVTAAHAHLLDRPSGLSDDVPQLGER